MNFQSITVPSMIDTPTFSDFSYFHNFVLGGRKEGFIFGVILLIVLAFVNLFTGSIPMFLICIGLAIIVPGGYFLFYRRSLRNQIAANNLTTPREAYTLTIDNRGVTASTATEKMTYPWNKIFRFYRTKHYFYIYIVKNRAFILPVKDLKGCTADLLWEYVNTKTDRTRFFKCRFPSDRKSRN